MNQIERQARIAKSNHRIWRNVLRSWVIVGAAAFLVGVAAGVAIAGRTQAAGDVLLVKAQAAEPIWTPAPEEAKPKFVAIRQETVPLSPEFQKYVHDVSVEYGVDFTLVLAVMAQESRFDSSAVSQTGDVGLMQINGINHPRLSAALGITDFSDPYQNVRAGVYMLRELTQRYYEPSRVLMAYHMGETAAASAWSQGIYETGYTRSVLRHQREIRAVWDAVPV